MDRGESQRPPVVSLHSAKKSSNSSHHLQRARLLSFMALQQKPKECQRMKTNKHLQSPGSRRKRNELGQERDTANTSD